MKEQINTPSSKEKRVPAQFICSNGEIETFPGYFISDQGQVASMKNKVMKVLRPGMLKTGYLSIPFRINKHQYNRSIHRLVLSSFKSEEWSKDRNEVDHVNKNKLDNRACNLRWVSSSTNQINRSTVARIKVTWLDDGHYEVFESMRAVCKEFGKPMYWCNNVINQCNGFNKSYNIHIKRIGARRKNNVSNIRVTWLENMYSETYENTYEVSRIFDKHKNWCDHIIRYNKGFCKELNICIEKIDSTEQPEHSE